MIGYSLHCEEAVLIPVAPFSVLFTAIVAAQAPECYSLSRIYLCGQPPRPPDLSMILVPTPTEEEFINHDVLLPPPNCIGSIGPPTSAALRRAPEAAVS